MYQTHRMYLQEKGEPSIQNLKWRTLSKIEYQQVEGTYMKRRVWYKSFQENPKTFRDKLTLFLAHIFSH